MANKRPPDPPMPDRFYEQVGLFEIIRPGKGTIDLASLGPARPDGRPDPRRPDHEDDEIDE